MKFTEFNNDACPVCGQTPCNCTHVAESKIKGADGKACWKGKRYAGTKNGKDICVPVSEGDVVEFPGGANVGQQKTVNRKTGNVTPLKAKKTKASGVSMSKDSQGRAVAQAQNMHSIYESSMAEGSLEEYGDTAKGQKMLTKVQKRAVDRMIKADDKRDAKNAKKNQQTANRAWERMTDLDEQGVAEGEVVSMDSHRPTEMSAEFINWLKANYPGMTLKDLKDPQKRNALYREFRASELAEASIVNSLKSAWEKVKNFDDPTPRYSGNTARREALRKKIELQKKQRKAQGSQLALPNDTLLLPNEVSEDSSEYNDESGMADNNLETLKRAVQGIDDVIQSGDNLPEWCQEKIAVAKSMLVTVWDYMKSEEERQLAEEFDMIERIVESIATHNGVDADVVWTDLESLTEDELYAFAVTSQLNEDWSKVNKKDRTDGMSRKAVKAYRRENPGSKLQTAVTTKPSKLKKGSKASKRRKSYCSRSRGQMKMHNISCAKTPDKAICKARRRWNC